MSCGYGECVDVEDCDGMLAMEWIKGDEGSSLGSDGEVWVKVVRVVEKMMEARGGEFM